MPGKGQKKVWPFLDPSAPGGMPALMELWVEAMRMRGLSEAHVDTCRMDLSAFIVFCKEQSAWAGYPAPITMRLILAVLLGFSVN